MWSTSKVQLVVNYLLNIAFESRLVKNVKCFTIENSKVKVWILKNHVNYFIVAPIDGIMEGSISITVL